jgi:Zn-dependent M28 family amino/carboxypeptidase
MDSVVTGESKLAVGYSVLLILMSRNIEVRIAHTTGTCWEVFIRRFELQDSLLDLFTEI